MIDPEHYVDLDIQLSRITTEASQNLKIWTHINSNVSQEMYHMYQEWTDISLSSRKKTKRNYSFLGLYRKFSEADVHDLVDMSKNDDIAERNFDIFTLFANFYGNSVFSIFYTKEDKLKWIAWMLERMDFPK